MKKIILFLLTIIITACAADKPGTSYALNNTSSDRQKILNVLHAEVKKRHHMDVTFTVHYLKIDRNWAYIETTGGGDPGINAVLKKAKGNWMLAKSAHPCSPVCPSGMPTCADGELICKNTLHKQFPNAPINIFPSPQTRRMVINP